MLPHWITSPNPGIYWSDNYIVMDVETTNLEKGRAVNPNNQLLYTFLTGPKIGDVEIVGGEFELSKHLDLIYSADFIVAHNAKFELQWLHRAGAELERILPYCTMLGDYVRSGNRRWRLDLDSVAGRYELGQKDTFIKKLMKAGICPSQMPWTWLHKYGRQDVRLTHEIFKRQRDALSREGLLPVFFSRCIFTPVVADMELNGMFLDKELVAKIHEESVAEHIAIIRELEELTGGINMASPQQVAKFIYGDLGFEELKDKKGRPLRNPPSLRFPEGTPRTDEPTISQLKPKNAKQKRFLELKGRESQLRKQITSYTSTFVEACEKDCLIFGSLNQAVTATHRLSSSNPNLQNVTRELKKVFTARHSDFRVHEVDYAQLEFRTAGFLAQDDQVREDIDNKADVHSYTSKTLTEAGQLTNRQDAKPHTFKPLYGGMSGTPAEVTYYKSFLKKYPQIKEMQDEWVREVLETGQLRTITGLIFYFPGTEYTASGYVTNSTNIKNYPVQMFATADIVPIGVTLVWHELKARKMKSFLVNEVHDSIILEEHQDESVEIRNLTEELLSNGVYRYLDQVYGIKFNYVLEIEHKLSSNWGYERKH